MKKPHGYIAVVSAIIISSILSIVVFSSSAIIFSARFTQLDDEDKLRADTLALSCAYEGLYAYTQDTSYFPMDQVIDLGQRENGSLENCTIDSITQSADDVILIVHASMHSAYSALEIEATANPIHITSWQEITSIPP